MWIYILDKKFDEKFILIKYILFNHLKSIESMAHNNLTVISRRKFSIKHSLLISEKSKG